MKILVMDDSREVLDALDNGLPDCKIEAVAGFEQFERKLQSEVFDCVVVDLSSIDQVFKQPIREIKRINKQAGIIVTSGSATLQDRIDALKAGADDFLMKPYEGSELAARIFSLLRRLTFLNEEGLVFKEIRMDMNAKLVYVNDIKLDLTKKELELLIYFIENKNRVITKQSLTTYLTSHGKDFRSSADIIYAHVKNLKKKLTEAGCNAYLKTVYGVGYKWENG